MCLSIYLYLYIYIYIQVHYVAQMCPFGGNVYDVHAYEVDDSNDGGYDGIIIFERAFSTVVGHP